MHYPSSRYHSALGPLALVGILAVTVHAAAPAPTISGEVRRVDGSPVSGAVVLASTNDWDPETRARLQRIRTATDENGRFTLTRPADWPPGVPLHLSAVARGLAVGEQVVAEPPAHSRFVLREETRLPVRVVDSAGGPVAGVMLHLSYGATLPPPEGRDIHPEADFLGFGYQVSAVIAPRTGPDGRSQVAHLPRKGQVTLGVRDPRWVEAGGVDSGPRTLSLADVPASPEITLVVRRAATIFGRVLTPARKPVANCQVQASGSGAAPAVATTDASGAFRVEGLAPGSCQLSFRIPRSLDLLGPGYREATLLSGQQLEGIEVVCPRGSRISGRVVQTRPRIPVAGARVGLIEPGDDVMRYTGTTDPAGRFQVRVPQGAWRVVVTPPRTMEFEPGLGDKPIPLLRTVANRNYDLGALRVTVRSKAIVRGRVVDADGKPVPDATVYYPVAEMPPQPLGLTSQVTTGADGSFTIDDPIEHRALLLRACKDGRITEEDVRVDPDRTDALGDRMLYVTLRLGKRRLAVLRGTVVDDAGKPVAGAAVSPAPGFRPDLSADPPLPRTDAAGQYRMEIWPGLSYQVAAWASEHGIGMGQRLTAHPGENPPLAPITIPRAGSFLDVLIADAEGRPVSNAPVSITVPDGQPFLFNRDRRTDSQGRLYVLGVLPATYSLEIRTGERVTQAKVTAGVRGIRITVPTAQTPH